MQRTSDQQERSRRTLQSRFNEAIVDHFDDLGYPDCECDAGDIVIAAAIILSSYCRAVHDKTKREDLLEKIVAQLRMDVLGGSRA